jgi:hypothetical protein
MKIQAKRMIMYTYYGALILLFTGCVMVTGRIKEGREVDEAKVKQIVIGKTKRSDIYKLFGTPHSQFRGQVEFKEGSLRGFFSHMENRYLSSIDDKHYVMLYRFTTSAGKGTGGTIVVVTFGDIEMETKSDELMLLLEQGTDTVVDVAYHK